MQYIDKYWILQTSEIEIKPNEEGFTPDDLDYIRETNKISKYLAICAERRKREIILTQRYKWQNYE